ncbi:hypothetical protein CHARACLAT_021377 [Characodon lateralis]|uniref:Secreted protein n=1 Tax=Characodon lateralis TaxID=208331 RepID=A0ABU7ED00_9TELE|nr:hypothetical protein [Characodon lateralis]
MGLLKYLSALLALVSLNFLLAIFHRFSIVGQASLLVNTYICVHWPLKHHLLLQSMLCESLQKTCFYMYAENIQLYISVPLHGPSLLHSLTRCAHSINEWMGQKVNADKTETIVFGPKNVSVLN